MGKNNIMLIKELLQINEEMKNTEQIADDVNSMFKKASPDFFIFRKSELGNLPGKVYTIVKDKNYNNGNPVAKFRVPVVNKDAGNSEAVFKKVFDEVWKLRNEGYFLTQAKGAEESADAWGNEDRSGNVMTFYVAGK